MTEQFNDNYEREFSWDDTIVNDAPDFIVLSPGEYWFKVESFERARHSGSEKLPPCNKAIVKIKISTPQGEAIIDHNLFLHSKTEGLLSAFFGAIGQKKHNQQLKMNWQTVPGSIGVCKIKNRVYNGNTYNEVQSMIYLEDVKDGKQLNQKPGNSGFGQTQTNPYAYAQQQAPQQPQQQVPAQATWQNGQF